MAVFVLILIFGLVIGLNFAKNIPIELAKHGKGKDIFKEQVAQKYKVLYWYAESHILYDLALVVWDFAFLHPWKIYTFQYDTQHHLYHSVQYLQSQGKMIVLVGTVVLVALYVYMIVSINLRRTLIVLGLIVLYEVQGTISRFNGSPYTLTLDLAWAAFTILVFTSLVLREPDFLKMIRMSNKT